MYFPSSLDSYGDNYMQDFNNSVRKQKGFISNELIEGGVLVALVAGVVGLSISFGYTDGTSVGITTRLGVPQPGTNKGVTWKSPIPFIETYRRWSTTRDNLDITDKELSIRFADGIQDFCAFTVAYRVNPNATDTQLGKLYLDFKGNTDLMLKQKAQQSILQYYKRVASYDVDTETDRAALEKNIQERVVADQYPFIIEEITSKGCAGSVQNEDQKRQLSAQRMEGRIIQQQIDNAGMATVLAKKYAATSGAAYKVYKENNVPDAAIPQLYCIETAKGLKGEYAAFALAGCNGAGTGASIAVGGRTAQTNAPQTVDQQPR
jgi:hypothetical protein